MARRCNKSVAKVVEVHLVSDAVSGLVFGILMCFFFSFSLSVTVSRLELRVKVNFRRFVWEEVKLCLRGTVL